MSESQSQRSEEVKLKPHKLFITGMDGSSDLQLLENQLREMFEKYEDLEAVVAKKSFNGAYCYAFVDFKQGFDATTVFRQMSGGCIVGGKKVKIQLQDNSRKKKGGEGCFQCGKPGHFARDCKSKSNKGRKERSRSNSGHKKKKRRHSYSSEDYSKSRSRSFRKQSKEKKKHSKKHKDKKQKSKSKKHKHKKQRRRSQSSAD